MLFKLLVKNCASLNTFLVDAAGVTGDAAGVTGDAAGVTGDAAGVTHGIGEILGDGSAGTVVISNLPSLVLQIIFEVLALGWEAGARRPLPLLPPS